MVLTMSPQNMGTTLDDDIIPARLYGKESHADEMWFSEEGGESHADYRGFRGVTRADKGRFTLRKRAGGRRHV
jgi:hypothetical protein